MTEPYEPEHGISGQPYSAPAGEAQPWLFSADEPPPAYPGRARAGYDGPNNLSWPPNTLPPPIYEDEPSYFCVPDVDPVPDGGDGGGGNRRTLAAALAVAAVLVVVAAYCFTRAVVGGPLFGGSL
jgi:hypothetical protein